MFDQTTRRHSPAKLAWNWLPHNGKKCFSGSCHRIRPPARISSIQWLSLSLCYCRSGRVHLSIPADVLGQIILTVGNLCFSLQDAQQFSSSLQLWQPNNVFRYCPMFPGVICLGGELWLSMNCVLLESSEHHSIFSPLLKVTAPAILPSSLYSISKLNNFPLYWIISMFIQKCFYSSSKYLLAPLCPFPNNSISLPLFKHKIAWKCVCSLYEISLLLFSLKITSIRALHCYSQECCQQPHSTENSRQFSALTLSYKQYFI